MKCRNIPAFLIVMAMALFFAVGAAAEMLTDETGQWKYIPEEGNATIWGCVEEPGGKLIVPRTLDGYPVTGIGDSAFSFCYDLQAVILPDTLTAIGDGAFSGCGGLTEITLPDSLTSLGVWAFAETGLTQITLPDALTVIGEATFWECRDLAQVTLPKGLLLIDTAAFLDCDLQQISLPGSLVYIAPSALAVSWGACAIHAPTGSYGERFAERMGMPYVAAADAAPQSRDIRLFEGFRYVVNEDGKTVTIWENMDKEAEWITVPDEIDGLPVTAIGVGAFAECALAGITLPQSLVSICDYAFCHSALTQIFLPDSLTAIGARAFYSCGALPAIYLPASIAHIGKDAFRRYSENIDAIDMIIYTPAGSYAETYAKQNRLPLVSDD